MEETAILETEKTRTDNLDIKTFREKTAPETFRNRNKYLRLYIL